MSSTRLHTSLEAWSQYSCEHFLAKNLGKMQITINIINLLGCQIFEPAFGLLLPVKLGTYQAESASYVLIINGHTDISVHLPAS